MRYIVGGVALGAALVIGTLASTAQATTPPVTTTPVAVVAPATDHTPARSAGLYAPTALVLTVGHGEHRADTAVQRAVTLSCTPKASGTHPLPAAACSRLRAVGGEFDRVTRTDDTGVCTREWDPVVVTADGVWQGRRVTYTHTFANSCELRAAANTVFAF
ncbi:subtilase-type protease inhibitor [Streptomyces benahoarensis]|uniref:Probable subtilase-type protease inhibitor n=1 Tax=Streptomyces benahoarensis TaxID=2595054 RepID=A0A553ZMD5_9ACTN|nr:subtilase-type protease inhibitor [Streptomyces benahoarensis]TSB31964.1 protease inhibitor protein [Streptomyces benahoarensis]TSB42607.1 protease inhibitor protein [Streptomyces benahoarensis]